VDTDSKEARQLDSQDHGRRNFTSLDGNYSFLENLHLDSQSFFFVMFLIARLIQVVID
jgi:hypothetical protein